MICKHRLLLIRYQGRECKMNSLAYYCLSKSVVPSWPLLRRKFVQKLSRTLTSVVDSRATGQELELTSARYNVQRGQYSRVEDKDLHFFEGLVPGRVITTDLEGYNTDWSKVCRGESHVLLKPKTTEEVSAILKYCNERHLAVCPQGGNTGLVGGSVPVFDEVIVSTQLMNQVISLDQVSGALVCQAGCILENLNAYLSEYDMVMPLDLGAKGSCNIGGNIATNAGGLRLLRYGSLHGTVLGVEAVLANGEVVDCLSSLRKDNTGYDVKQLFIGSEGTLGIVTAASILCPRLPSAVNLAFLGCEKFEDVLTVFQKSKGMLGEILSAFEMMDFETVKVVVENLKVSNPLSDYPFYILIETSGSNGAHDEEKLNSFLEHVMSEGVVNDGLVCMDNTQMMKIWSLRDLVAEAMFHDGHIYLYDISLPLTHFYHLVEDMRVRLSGNCTRIVGYGHVGDGNLHFNVSSPEYDPELLGKIEPYIYEWTAKHRGSISAEHGLGFKKKDFIHFNKSPAVVNIMKQMKCLLDPKGILNPYKVFPGS